MEFYYDINTTELEGQLLYIKDDYSLLYEPFCPNVGVSIMCGEYTSLDTICETGVIAHISGYNSKQSWIAKEMEMPLAKKGQLKVHFDEPPMKGTGIDYDRSWNTFYDMRTNWLCIGDIAIEGEDDCIEFASKIIAVLRGKQLVAIWAQIKEV
jgi:hypothetical protein